LKAHLKGQKGDVYSAYSDLLVRQPTKFDKVLDIAEIMFALSPTTAHCERGFSKMNLIKTSLRTSLCQTSLQALLRIQMEGPSLADFDPKSAISTWCNSGGKKHGRV
jgi:hypothetical protein